jgi:uncharacterized protein YbcC (UPF0753/DUF2309 family)
MASAWPRAEPDRPAGARGHRRTTDWAGQTEWALTDCARSSIATPPQQNQTGRPQFLHDYSTRPRLCRAGTDRDRAMVVTNWINLQYYASTVDNQRYGGV